MREKLQIALGALMALSASLAAALKAASGGQRLEVFLSIALAACGVGLVITGILQSRKSAVAASGGAPAREPKG
jgi:hypothetical protein